jgi:hypothetical protein
MSDYGKCHLCGEQMQEKRINQEFWLKGMLVVIESVRRRLSSVRREDCKSRGGATPGLSDRKSAARAKAKDH